jgi:predicted transcriptional regulator
MKILLSIKPEFVERIFSGEKKFEYRKVLFSDRRVKTVVVYSTMPVGKIVGEFQIKSIQHDSPNALWSKTKEYAGVDGIFFQDYFSGREYGFAIEIGDVTQYESPIDPKDVFDKFTAPQSFFYVRDDMEVMA